MRKMYCTHCYQQVSYEKTPPGKCPRCGDASASYSSVPLNFGYTTYTSLTGTVTPIDRT